MENWVLLVILFIFIYYAHSQIGVYNLKHLKALFPVAMLI